MRTLPPIGFVVAAVLAFTACSGPTGAAPSQAAPYAAGSPAATSSAVAGGGVQVVIKDFTLPAVSARVGQTIT